MSTGLCDRFHSSNIVPVIKPKTSRILSSAVKLINGSCREKSKLDPSVEELFSL